MRILIHYLLATAVLILYGSRVCPFLESLTVLQLGAPIAIALFLQWLLHQSAISTLIDKSALEGRVKQALITEMSVFICSGIALAIFNSIYYGFPVVSGLKVIVGFSALGFFISIDYALECERKIAAYCQKTDTTLKAAQKYFPVSRKLAAFSAITTVIVTLILFLVIIKDLDWLTEVSGEIPLMDAKHSILKEFFFISVVVVSYVLNTIRSYTLNLKLFFDSENQALEATNKGNLNSYVAISTNDEFGIMARHTNKMVDAIRQRSEEIQRTQDVAILSLATLAETRDNETGAHILRTQRYVKALAVELSVHDRFCDELKEDAIELLFKSAPLHDIGKVGIPDAILLKPGKLTEEEFEIMKTHAMLGSEALKQAEQGLGETSFLRYAREIAETHHEKWDGSGYPKGLKGDAIPVSGRLMALADVYDALISKRVYKPAFSHDRAKEIILQGAGRHFDPDVVKAFQNIEQEFVDIAASYSDEEFDEVSNF